MAFDSPVTRATSGRHIFETNANRFTLILQAHNAKPTDNLAEQALVRQGQTDGIEPVDHLRRRLDASPTAFKE